MAGKPGAKYLNQEIENMDKPVNGHSFLCIVHFRLILLFAAV